MVKLSRAVTGTESPNLARRLAGWRSVAFTNFIPITVGDGPGVKKTDAMWRQAHDGWRSLLDDLKPHQAICLGIDFWNEMPTPDTSYQDEARIDGDSFASVTERWRGYQLSNGSVARCWAHWHPRRGGSWQSIHDAIAKAEATL